jgi:hypothetical protein
VFVDPSSVRNPWDLARDAKGNYAWPEQFKRAVLPTLAKDAKCVRFVLLKWHRLLFWEDMQEDYSDSGDDDSDSGDDDSDSGDDDSEKEDRQEDGEQRRKQDLKERIQRKYEAVLELLDMGIERLRGG